MENEYIYGAQLKNLSEYEKIRDDYPIGFEVIFDRYSRDARISFLRLVFTSASEDGATVEQDEYRLRFNRPSAERKFCREDWLRNGRHHRSTGPAIVERALSTGVVTFEAWFNAGVQHNEHGPSRIQRDPKTGVCTTEEWRLNGALHRVGGPAVIVRDPNGSNISVYHFVHGRVPR